MDKIWADIVQESAKPNISGSAILFAVYFFFAAWGLMFDPVSGFATLVWPPTGIALVALFLFGRRLWPGVALGAFLANFLTGAPLLVALGISFGNTMEAVAGSALLKRYGFNTEFSKMRDVLIFVFFGAFVATVISATLGASILLWSGIASWATFFDTWKAWWTGDIVGTLIVGSFLFTLLNRTCRKNVGKIIQANPRETAALLFITLLIALVLFWNLFSSYVETALYLPLFFIPFLWAAIRFRPLGVTTVALLMSILAIWGTVTAQTPESERTLAESLFTLQIAMAATMVVILSLATAVKQWTVTEQKLRLINKNLEEVVSTRTAKLQEQTEAFSRANLELKRQDRAKTEFVSIASHQLRTPLSIVRWYAEMLNSNEVGPLNPQQKTYTERIYQGNKRMIYLVNALLQMTRAELETFPRSIKRVDLCSLADRAARELQGEFKKKNQRFQKRCQENISRITADPDHIHIIFQNLLSNASKYTPEWGAITLEIAEHQEPRQLVATIQDTGYGIPNNQQRFIFQKMFRADNAKELDQEGVGIGLYIAKTLVERMGGSISFTSKEQQGTTFFVTFPCA